MLQKMKLARLFYLTFLCLFYCIVCSYSSTLASEITSVELKMWKDYTPEEKEFLQGRWKLGRVDSVVVVLKDWDKIGPGSEKVCSLFEALAGNFTIVPAKEWKEYTQAEKNVLRLRWTDKKIGEVAHRLKFMDWYIHARKPHILERDYVTEKQRLELEEKPRSAKIADLVAMDFSHTKS